MASNWSTAKEDAYYGQTAGQQQDIWSNGTVYYVRPPVSGPPNYAPPPHQGDWLLNYQNNAYGGRSRNAEEFFNMFRRSGGREGADDGASGTSNFGVPNFQGAAVGGYGYQDSYLPTMVYNSSSNNNHHELDWGHRDNAASTRAVSDEMVAVGGPTSRTFGKAPGGPLDGSRPHPNRQPPKEEVRQAFRKGSDRLYRNPSRQNRSLNATNASYDRPATGHDYSGNRGGGKGVDASTVELHRELKSAGRHQQLSQAGTDRRTSALSRGAEPAESGRSTKSLAKSSGSVPYHGKQGAGRRAPPRRGEFWKGGNKEDWKTRNVSKGDDKVTVDQRERLTEQLHRGTLECLVCYDRIRQVERVWSCTNCHHVLHLGCIVKWVNSSTDAAGGESGWRCPACQNVTQNIPTEYKCMCGKVKDPQWVRGETPHCCGSVCGKLKDCPHGCTLLCHPGACPPCCANVERSCGCGRTSRLVLCSSSVTFECDHSCDRPRNCGLHACTSVCHQGPCFSCEKTIHQTCHCGSADRDLACDGDALPPEMGGSSVFSCGATCPRVLACGRHPCRGVCHPPPCEPCPLSPSVLVKCQCGKVGVPPGTRTSCEDPVVICGNICDRELKCGQLEARHRCKVKCHEGPCPTCEGVTSVLCRCNAMAKNIDCKDLTGNAEDTKCQKRCTKKRNCGKHKCNQQCCVEQEHFCPLVCNKTLGCGQHKCERLCHKGHCPLCLSASFEELHCECGKSVILPPVPCGTRVPDCSEKCGREHSCGHAPLHNCHSLPDCPPCTVFVSRYCHGAHELRKTVPCHMGEYSCGLACSKSLPCGHKCIKTCHADVCLPAGTTCSQPCTQLRELSCSHPCAAPCHPGKPCPQNNLCQAKVEVTCECGRRKMTRTCSENSSEYQRIATSLLAAKMADVRMGKSVDTADMSSVASKMSLKTLECNDECRLQERNLRLAIGLQIANPDLSSKLHPRYSEAMKTWSKKDRRFCEMVHDKLTQLVQLAKTSKQKSRAHSFQSMGAAKRQFIHEYCEHFGIESIAYDPEPNRNIVATAWKDKCWLPSYSLMEVVARESGHRKGPILLPSLKKDFNATESAKLVSSGKPKSSDDFASFNK